MEGFVGGSLFSTIEACGCPVELSNGCLACVENCDGCLCESFTGVAKKRDDGVCVGCGRREVNAGERVFKVLYLGWCPGTHPDVVMRGMCDGGGVGKVTQLVTLFGEPRVNRWVFCQVPATDRGQSIKFCTGVSARTMHNRLNRPDE